MISDAMEKALNDQINAEYHSSYIYLAMAAYFEGINMRGFANWMTVQAREEMVHVMKFYRYVFERGSRVVLKAIPAPPKEWKSILDAFKAAYAHEQMISGRINKLMELAVKEKDFATQALLQWFVTEQVEEESSAFEWVTKLEMVGDSKHGLYMMDREAGARAFKG
jgi:ferritin